MDTLEPHSLLLWFLLMLNLLQGFNSISGPTLMWVTGSGSQSVVQFIVEVLDEVELRTLCRPVTQQTGKTTDTGKNQTQTTFPLFLIRICINQSMDTWTDADLFPICAIDPEKMVATSKNVVSQKASGSTLEINDMCFYLLSKFQPTIIEIYYCIEDLEMRPTTGLKKWTTQWRKYKCAKINIKLPGSSSLRKISLNVWYLISVLQEAAVKNDQFIYVRNDSHTKSIIKLQR